MLRLDAARLERANYRHSTRLETRFGDLDELGHVNNVSMVGLIEEARTRVVLRLRIRETPGRLAPTPPAPMPMVASQQLDYLKQVSYPEPLEVYTAVTEVGRTSFSMGHLVLQEEQPVVLASGTFVLVRDGRPVEIPAHLRAELEALAFHEPESARGRGAGS